MAKEPRTIEEHAPTVEEAIEAGLSRLGLSEAHVDIVIIDEGRRGLLGIGGREAIVRLSERAATAVAPKEAPSQPDPVKPVTPAASQQAPPAKKPTAPKQSAPASMDRSEATSATAVIVELLDLMDVTAEVATGLAEPDDLTGRQMTVVTINGDDLGLLIGPRGETLDALQHITRLMVGHQIRQRANFVLDIDGYRSKREQALTRLAERMGQKAIDRGSPVTLEPMPAYDRRIIHIALRENPQVRTESTGEGSRRRVRIYPL